MGANAVTTVPVYVAGEVLTAADMNITNSGIPVFASTVERDAAFGGTGEKTLAEGQFAYLETGNLTQYYDGATWQSLAAGVLQVKSTALLTTFTTSSATFTGVTGLTVSITPSSASNKVLVIAQIAYGPASNAGIGHFKLSGGNAGTYVGATAGSRVSAVFGGFSAANEQEQILIGNIVYLDSPATTSATTYGVDVRTAFNGSVFINRTALDSDSNSNTRGASSITVMEISA